MTKNEATSSSSSSSTTTKTTTTSSSKSSSSLSASRRPPLWRVWLTAARPHTLTASISPVMVGYFATLAMYRHRHHHHEAASPSQSLSLLSSIAWRWLLFCVLIQLGTNLHNDYADFVLGADDDKRMGHARATQKKWVTPMQMATAATSCLILALFVGMTLVYQLPLSESESNSYYSYSFHSRTWVWFIILSSIFNAFCYTGGNCYPFSYLGFLKHWSISYSGLGDIMCFLYFGLVASLMIPFFWWNIVVLKNANDTSTLLLSSSSSFHESAWTLWWIVACQAGCFSTAILVVNNIRDRHTDVLANKRTMVVRWGVTMARVQYAILVLTPYLLVLYTKWYVFAKPTKQTDADYDDDDDDSLLLLLPLMSLPLINAQLQAVSGAQVDGPALNPHVGGTARIQFLFSILQSIALYLYHRRRHYRNQQQ